jgi:hypothetical protein
LWQNDEFHVSESKCEERRSLESLVIIERKKTIKIIGSVFKRFRSKPEVFPLTKDGTK